MENIDIKKVIIFLAIVFIIIFGVIFGITKITSKEGKYIPEEIKEEDYKYFSVYTDKKFGVIDTSRQNDY